MDCGSTTVDRSSRRAQECRRKLHWGIATRNVSGLLVRYGQLHRSDHCQHLSVDEAEGTVHVEMPKSARKVMQIHSVGI